MQHVTEILQYGFFQKALIAALIASIASGIIGSYIVIKRISLISGSIAHTAFGGLGMSIYFGLNPLVGALSFGVLAATFIAIVKEKAQNRLNSLLSITWAVGMAIGLIFVFLTPGYVGDLMTYLFGNILLVSLSDLWLMAGLTVVICAIVYHMYHTLLAVTFNETFAKTRNINVMLVYWILFLLISVTVVLLIRIVGIVLLIALLTLPSATAQLLTRSLKSMILLSIIIAITTTVGGLWIAYLINFPSGPVIVLFASLVYAVALLLSHRFKKVA